jgi:hypothetical protein
MSHFDDLSHLGDVRREVGVFWLAWAVGAGAGLVKIDVTLRPDLLAAKRIRPVPVVEAGARLLFGLVKTKDLAEAIAGAQPAGA